jgi:hypothetical protein
MARGKKKQKKSETLFRKIDAMHFTELLDYVRRKHIAISPRVVTQLELLFALRFCQEEEIPIDVSPHVTLIITNEYCTVLHVPVLVEHPGPFTCRATLNWNWNTLEFGLFNSPLCLCVNYVLESGRFTLDMVLDQCWQKSAGVQKHFQNILRFQLSQFCLVEVLGKELVEIIISYCGMSFRPAKHELLSLLAHIERSATPALAEFLPIFSVGDREKEHGTTNKGSDESVHARSGRGAVSAIEGIAQMGGV